MGFAGRFSSAWIDWKFVYIVNGSIISCEYFFLFTTRVCVCVLVCLCLCMWVCICVYVYLYMCVYLCMFVYACVYLLYLIAFPFHMFIWFVSFMYSSVALSHISFLSFPLILRTFISWLSVYLYIVLYILCIYLYRNIHLCLGISMCSLRGNVAKFHSVTYCILYISQKYIITICFIIIIEDAFLQNREDAKSYWYNNSCVDLPLVLKLCWIMNHAHLLSSIYLDLFLFYVYQAIFDKSNKKIIYAKPDFRFNS